MWTLSVWLPPNSRYISTWRTQPLGKPGERDPPQKNSAPSVRIAVSFYFFFHCFTPLCQVAVKAAESHDTSYKDQATWHVCASCDNGVDFVVQKVMIWVHWNSCLAWDILRFQHSKIFQVSQIITVSFLSFFKPVETSCSRCPQLMHCVASFKSTSIANLPFLHCAWIFVFLKQCSKYAKNAILQLLYLVTIQFSVIDSWEGDLRDPKVPAAKTTTEQMATVSLL